MGSAKVSSAKPIAMTETEKKSFKKRIIDSLSFFNKDKKKDNKNRKPEESQKVQHKINPVDKIVENFQKLEIQHQNKKDTEEEDESQFFTYKIVEDDRRSERVDSQSSEDSGFSEVKEEPEEVIDSLKNLKIDGGDKKKKSKTVLVSRGPIRGKVSDYTATVRPYPVGQQEETFRQINQINKHTLTGGQVVIVNDSQLPDHYLEFELALNSLKNSECTSDENWQDVIEVINDDRQTRDTQCPVMQTTTDVLSDFNIQNENFDTIQIVPTEMPEPNPTELSTTNNFLNYEECVELSTIMNLENVDEGVCSNSFTFLTPPHSVNVPSPMSDSQTSFYPSNSDYTLSPERSSPIYNSDLEKYQDLTHFDEFPSPITETESKDKGKRERTSSISSMTMKQFKDMQKEIANDFSKKECCALNRRSCKEIFQEHLSKLELIERKNLCLKVAKLDLKTANGVLHHILLSLSRRAEQEDLQYALFGLVCERVLAQKPALFADDFGLSLLKSAALRCPNRPILTRYVVQCVRSALKTDAALTAGKEYIFHEVDAQGDNLVTACARAGDTHAPVLAEIVRAEPDQPPLFRAHHSNTDGFTALHVSCSQHSARAPRLHTVHVLLTHAGADLWKGDMKGGDTALHLAVNSANCDLQLIMLLFKHIDRKLWKSLAHCRNMSSVTPLDCARSAAKTTTRQNYPQEVLDFLKKCR